MRALAVLCCMVLATFSASTAHSQVIGLPFASAQSTQVQFDRPFGPWTVNPTTTVDFHNDTPLWNDFHRGVNTEITPVYLYQRDALGDQQNIVGGRVVTALPLNLYLVTSLSHAFNTPGPVRLKNHPGMSGTRVEYDLTNDFSLDSDGLHLGFIKRW